MEISEVPIEEAIEKLDKGIKRLRIDFDRYLAGSLDRPPKHLQAQVEAFIRYYRNNTPKSFHHRFQINSLISRYNIFRELWARQVRNHEMGIQRPHLRLGSMQPEQTDPLGKRPVNGNGSGNGKSSESDSEKAEVQSLFQQFNELHKRHKGANPKVPIEAFARRIRKCRDDIRTKTGCASVDFRFTVDDNLNIRLKAKPSK